MATKNQHLDSTNHRQVMGQFLGCAMPCQFGSPASAATLGGCYSRPKPWHLLLMFWDSMMFSSSQRRHRGNDGPLKNPDVDLRCIEWQDMRNEPYRIQGTMNEKGWKRYVLDTTCFCSHTFTNASIYQMCGFLQILYMVWQMLQDVGRFSAGTCRRAHKTGHQKPLLHNHILRF